MGGDCEVFLCGDDAGVAEAAAQAGARHLGGIACNEFGTPLLSDAFRRVAEASGADAFCYVNGDIILSENPARIVRLIARRPFLALSRRINIGASAPLDFANKEWREKLGKLVREKGVPGTESQLDVMLFSRTDCLLHLPPFAVGRPAWDNWYVYNAWKHGVAIVDATQLMPVIHQDHDYSHVPCGRNAQWEGPEGDRNRQLAGGFDNLFTILDSSHLLSPDGLRHARAPEHVERRMDRVKQYHPYLFSLLASWKVRRLFSRVFTSV